MTIRAVVYAHLRTWLKRINDSFWFRPLLLAILGIVFADLLIHAGHASAFQGNPVSFWLYNGGRQGARTLLGTIAGSMIGVAGTTFTITITTLTLASQQMGPRVLRNFTHDHGNQFTLGVFLGTFSYSLEVLGSVRGSNAEIVVPRLAITGAIVLALCCVVTLIYFVNHIARRIDLDVVIEVLAADFETSVAELSSSSLPSASAGDAYWTNARPVSFSARGYVQYIDEEALAGWADAHQAAIRVRLRPGDFYFPGTCLAEVIPQTCDPTRVLARAVSFGTYPTLSMDIEFSVSQLVDMAARALSPNLNDPHTAMRVLDHLGAGLCRLVGRHLSDGTIRHNGRVVYQRRATDYDRLTHSMFDIIRQNARRSPPTVIHFFTVLSKVAEAERAPDRLDILEQHGRLMLEDATQERANDRDIDQLRRHADHFHEVLLLSRAAISATPHP